MSFEEGLRCALLSLQEKERDLLKELNSVSDSILQKSDELYSFNVKACKSLDELLRFVRHTLPMGIRTSGVVDSQFGLIVKGLFPNCGVELSFAPWGPQVKIGLTKDLDYDSDVLKYFLEVADLTDILLVSKRDTYTIFPLENNRFCLEMYTQFTPDIEFESLTELLEFVYGNENERRYFSN